MLALKVFRVVAARSSQKLVDIVKLAQPLTNVKIP